MSFLEDYVLEECMTNLATDTVSIDELMSDIEAQYASRRAKELNSNKAGHDNEFGTKDYTTAMKHAVFSDNEKDASKDSKHFAKFRKEQAEKEIKSHKINRMLDSDGMNSNDRKRNNRIKESNNLYGNNIEQFYIDESLFN